MKKGLTILAVIIGIALVAGFLVLKLVPAKKIVAAAVPEIENLKVSKAVIGEEQATLWINADIRLDKVPVFIDSLEYEMRLFGQTVSKGRKAFEKNTKNGNVQNLTLPMTMNHNKTRELVRHQVAENEPVQVIMKAYTDVPVLGKETFDINKKMDLVVPALPGMEVKDLHIKDFGLDNMEMVMTMAIDNPNEFDFYVTEMKYGLVLKDFMIANGNVTKRHLVKARSVTPLDLTATADTKKSLKNTFKIMTGKPEYAYTMKTQMQIQPKGGVVGNVTINSVKTGSINVVEQLKNVKETKKAKKKAEKEEKKKA